MVYFQNQKIQIWVNYGGSCNGRCCYILSPLGMYMLRPFGLCYDPLLYVTAIWYMVYFVAIWYILWSFGIFFPFRYVVLRKIWQPWYIQIGCHIMRWAPNPGKK
jgi:hypothetical protein